VNGALRRLLCVALVWCCVSASAHADELELAPGPDAAAMARAREHYLAGSRWLESGEWAKALYAYEQAFGLYPSASTLFNMAYCNSQLGRLVAAWLHVSEALRLSESSEALRLTPERRSAVEDERERLRARVPTLLFQGTEAIEVNVFGARIKQTPDPAPVYYLEATSVPEEEWTLIPAGTRVLVDPGVHRLTVRSEGRLFPQHLVLSEGETIVVAEPQEDSTAARQPSPAVAVQGAPPPGASVAPARGGAPPVDRPRSNPYRTAGVISLALGGASLVAALVAVGFMVDAESDLGGRCDDDGGCPDELAPEVTQYRSAATAANVGIALGVGASTVGVGLLWLGRKDDSPQVRAGLGPGSLYLRGTF